jgi:hypothetical protein
MELQEAIVARTELVLGHVLRMLELDYEVGILLMEGFETVNWLFAYIRRMVPPADLDFEMEPAVEALEHIEAGKLTKDSTYEDALAFTYGLFIAYYMNFVIGVGKLLIEQPDLMQE